MDSPATQRHFRFGVQGGPLLDPAALATHAQNVEALGYDELFTSDHVGRPGSGGRKGGMFSFDPFLPLVVATEATTTLRVGPLVLNTEFYNPALLARTAATADNLMGGRLVLGLGTGYSEAEHESIGSPIRPPGPRVTRFGETLAVLRALLDTGAVDHDGEYESLHIDDLGVEPSQNPLPFLIGGHGKRVVGLSAQYADVFQFTGLTRGEGGMPTAGGFALADLVERSRWLADAAGERSDRIERSALVQFTHVGGDAPSTADVADQFELGPETVEETPFILSGSVEQVIDKIGRLRETLGITHYVVRDPEGFASIVDALDRKSLDGQ